jgi:two-component system copper resistance phosphate regulon response regulator CusR
MADLKMHILIVTGDPHVKSRVAVSLSEMGFVIDCADEARLAVSLTRSTDYDLLLIDSVLRPVDGAALVQHLRSMGNGMPVLLLVDSDLEQEALLVAGVDDVLLKTFTRAELTQRVAALLRTFAKPCSAKPTRLLVADLEVDLIRRRSFRAHRELDLTLREFSTLELLMNRHGEIVPHTLIATALTTENRSGDAIQAHMGRLRRKVDGSTRHKLVHAVRGGFVLEERGLRLSPYAFERGALIL